MAPKLTSDDLRERARRAYEHGRLRTALLGSLPLLAIAAIAGLIEHQWALVAISGSLLFAASAWFRWRGLGLGRGVLPGVLAGVVPFVAIHAARYAGHVCSGAVCFSWCIPACAMGGVVAGLVIARVARASGTTISTWASAGVMAALTGSLACACVGVFGIAGLVAGLLVGSIPLALRPHVSSTHS